MRSSMCLMLFIAAGSVELPPANTFPCGHLSESILRARTASLSFAALPALGLRSRHPHLPHHPIHGVRGPDHTAVAATGNGGAGNAQQQAIRRALRTVYEISEGGEDRLWASLPNTVVVEQATSRIVVEQDEDDFLTYGDDLTYGEFDLAFFCRLLEMACPRRGEVFCDVGSGTGRLVFAAAAMLPSIWSVARGVEIIAALHDVALEAQHRSEPMAAQMSAVEFVLADVHQRKDVLLDVGVCFCYSTAFSAFGPYLSQLSATFGLALREGARVITVDKQLLSDGPWEYKEIGRLEGSNRQVGKSTAYVYLVVKSPNGPK